MGQKKRFNTPKVLRLLAIQPEDPILAASVVDDITLVSVGQEVKDYDFSPDNEDGFNFNWED